MQPKQVAASKHVAKAGATAPPAEDDDNKVVSPIVESRNITASASAVEPVAAIEQTSVSSMDSN